MPVPQGNDKRARFALPSPLLLPSTFELCDTPNTFNMLGVTWSECSFMCYHA